MFECTTEPLRRKRFSKRSSRLSEVGHLYCRWRDLTDPTDRACLRSMNRTAWPAVEHGRAGMEEGEFRGRIGRYHWESEPAWPPEPAPPDGAPNVLLVLLDDV